eukprot:ctg_2934.g589
MSDACEASAVGMRVGEDTIVPDSSCGERAGRCECQCRGRLATSGRVHRDPTRARRKSKLLHGAARDARCGQCGDQAKLPAAVAGAAPGSLQPAARQGGFPGDQPRAHHIDHPGEAENVRFISRGSTARRGRYRELQRVGGAHGHGSAGACARLAGVHLAHAGHRHDRGGTAGTVADPAGVGDAGVDGAAGTAVPAVRHDRHQPSARGGRRRGRRRWPCER